MDGVNLWQKEYEVAAFSYLARAKIFKIDTYPHPNDGAEINNVIDTIAADGPIVVATLVKLGMPSCLLANSVGIDSDARRLIGHLNAAEVIHDVQTYPHIRTPFIVVTSDNAGNRNWFSYIREVISDLEQVELNVLMKANLVYIDLYQCIKTASLRALSYCLENKLPLFLNISNSVSDDELLAAIDLNGAGVIQASIAEDNFNQSEQSAKNLFNRCHPQLVIVTTGAHGATAYDGKTFHYADAIPIEPLHVHGAGAAFSAGFLSQFLRGKSLQECLDLGCAAGSLSCIKERIFEEISPTVIQAFMKKYNG